MCGICGELSWDSPSNPSITKRMMARLEHRGPDAGGLYSDRYAVLGHRRLSIIDLSAAGNQPMADSTSTFRIAFNGEIYNYLELRRDLENTGSIFHTRTDTEVILEAYKKWGVDCLNRFNGMFAFAIWDTARLKLFIARDRLGKKPLFYSLRPGGRMVFASELAALTEDPSLRGRVNLKAIGQYLSLSYNLNQEPAISDVRSLQAGHYAIFEREKMSGEIKYWDLTHFFRNKRVFLSEKEASEELASLIEDATKLRMISDVPLGAFLSGGVDSSAIVAAMRRIAGPNSVKTYSIGFSEKSFSEVEWAQKTASALDVAFADKTVTEDMTSEMKRIIHFAGQPFADTSMIPMYYLAKFARENVTVCLSGDGADELFAGYETYVADKIHQNTSWMPNWAVRLLRWTGRIMPVSFDKVSFDYKLRQFIKGFGLDFSDAHYSWREIFTEEEKRELLNPSICGEALSSPSREVFRKYHDEAEGLHYIDKALYVDMKTWLTDDILVKVDRMTMAHSLEARAPFLDHRLVEFAAALPPAMKLNGFSKKWIFKKSQGPYLPSFVLKRKKKGFNAPVSHWLTGSMIKYRDSVLNATVDNGRVKLFNEKAVERLWSDHENRKVDNGFKLLTLVNLSLWLEEIGGNDSDKTI